MGKKLFWSRDMLVKLHKFDCLGFGLGSVVDSFKLWLELG